MREGRFIKQNLKKWEEYQSATDDPDEVARRFTSLVDDLSYAKTFFPFSNTVKYINAVAAQIYLSIYRNKKEKSQRMITFWTKELPIVIRRQHNILLASFVFFLVFVALGVFSEIADQNFARSILGDEYVEMTERNIANGDPFGVFKGGNQVEMFLFIAWHNINIAFFTYTTGLLFGLGTAYFLFSNGVMVGVFETMFFRHHVGLQSITVVFIHGTLELSAIVIAAGAGFVLGGSLLFPGTYSRLQSLKNGAKDSIKIIVSLVPIFIMAAFFEGFVTRHTEMPLLSSLSILVGSASFIAWYYIIYPIKLTNKLSRHATPL